MRQKPYGLLQLLPIFSGPWQEIVMDFILKLPLSKDFSKPRNLECDSIWAVINQFTKMACFLPYRKDTRAGVLA